jgi:hypothetical protein
MRVNARFEGVAEQQVTYLATTTGLKVSDVLRDSVDFYYRHVRGESAGGLKHFSKMIGQGHSGRSDIAGNYKAHLSDSLAAKYNLQPAPSALTGTDAKAKK